jgi:tetratricopeptide (TPR) repeat protein
MVSNKFLPNILSLVLGAVLITASSLWRPVSQSEVKALIGPPPHLEYFSFGFQMVVADSLWIRAIQDFDYCETPVGKNLCKGNSWLFQMLDAITNLSPDFLEPYREGAIALSVLVSDIEGASKLFDKGVPLHSNNFNFLYRAAYHAMYEEKNSAKAGELFMKAARVKGKDGDWLYSLATRLLTDGGKREMALRLYEEMKDSGLDEGFLSRMREKLGLTK